MAGAGPEHRDEGVPVWVPVLVVVVIIGLIATAVLLLLSADPESSPTTVLSPSATSTTAEDIEMPDTTAASPTVQTTTTSPVTTTTQSAGLRPFVGWWQAQGLDGSLLDLRIDADGVILFWDSASEECDQRGVRSPQTWTGSVAASPSETTTLNAVGMKQCHLYGAENPEPVPAEMLFSHNNETDTLEAAAGGIVYARSAEVPGQPIDASNPLVGSWEATDSDGTRVTMNIGADGSWESKDTRSGGCERNGFTYATWSAVGTGEFELGPRQLMRVSMTTSCKPQDGAQQVLSSDVEWTFAYDQTEDTLALVESAGVTYTRLP